MRISFLLLLALLARDERAQRFYDLTLFNKFEAKGEEERRVMDQVLKQEHWIGAFALLEEKLGRLPDDLSLTVDFTLEGEELARAGGRGNQGGINFNLKELAKHQKRIDEIERERQELLKKNRRLMFRVPPLKFERIVYHEMTHIFQRGCDAPNWFNEGMAQWIGDDPNSLYVFAVSGRPVQGVDVPMFERNDIYARGHLFWKWLDSRGAAKKVGELVVTQRRPWKQSLEEGTGLVWGTIAGFEQEWSRKEIEKLRARD